MNICNLDIGHFKLLNLIEKTPLRSLKNLPTTWGLRPREDRSTLVEIQPSEKPPHHMGIKTHHRKLILNFLTSEKPPHHMGIKTDSFFIIIRQFDSEKPPHHMGIKTTKLNPLDADPSALKNLPTTWGLRLQMPQTCSLGQSSEKPPHHMGIKTDSDSIIPNNA